MLVGLENSALLPPRIMLRVHHTIRKDQRFGKGKADDQGRQLVSISTVPTPQSLTPFGRSVLSPLDDKAILPAIRRNYPRQAVNPICSISAHAVSPDLPALPHQEDSTACLSPFQAPFSRQSQLWQ
jgi:hypothetical protein